MNTEEVVCTYQPSISFGHGPSMDLWPAQPGSLRSAPGTAQSVQLLHTIAKLRGTNLKGSIAPQSAGDATSPTQAEQGEEQFLLQGAGGKRKPDAN